MKLRELLAVLPASVQPPSHPALDREVKGLTTNSLACQSGDLFIGMPGTRVDGGDFWASAIAAGAVAVVLSESAAEKAKTTAEGRSACLISASDMAVACAKLAATFYGSPAQIMQLVGVTGTNGKTTTTHLIEHVLIAAGRKSALFGTLYTRWPGFEKVASHTTPFAVDLHQQFREAVDAGCDSGIMEVSSHALDQGRVLECPFEVAVFTNLTQDHLDYHGTMENYFVAKAKLFSPQYCQGRAIVNLDDPYGQRIVQEVADPAKLWTYSKENSEADLWTSDLVYGPAGVQGMVHTPKGTRAFSSPLVGQFNLENLLAAVGAGLHLGLELEAIVASLTSFGGVPGRMERVQVSSDQDISVIVDYAHTPDSLDNLLKASRPFIRGQMICVFGCGGDRDRTKRPLMGGIAARLADVAIVTSDNPRTEDPQQILKDVLAGIPDTITPVVQVDRATAIREAILNAKPGDGVLIAGKGHEDYQILGTEKIHFDDREQARDGLTARLNKSH